MRESLRLESVNVGRAESIRHGNKVVQSGIRKLPVEGPTSVDELGLRGDAILDESHGGPDQAVYVYGADDYDWWRAHSEHAVAPGVFGENLTIRGLPSDMNVGDRLLIGEVVLEATAPRIPCSTLAARMQDSGFGIEFRRAERPGAYFRVLNGGEIAAGDTVTFVADDDSDVSILELFRSNYALTRDAESLQRFLAAPVAIRFREKIEGWLAAMEDVSA